MVFTVLKIADVYILTTTNQKAFTAGYRVGFYFMTAYLTAGNHVTTTDSLHIKYKQLTSSILISLEIAQKLKWSWLYGYKCSGSGGESYLEGF